jgi:AraC-like DNA-binding protein/quercetin dioxygenase-like cupin family protein
MNSNRRFDTRSTGDKPGWSIDGELRLMSAAVPPNPDSISRAASHFLLAVLTDAPVATTIGFSMEAGGLEGDAHQHREAQLLYPVRGEFTCEASSSWWIVPPGSALWVPGGVSHRVRGTAPLEGYNVFVNPNSAGRLPAECMSVSVSPLLREIVLSLASRPANDDPDREQRLISVLMDELADVATDAHRLPMPTDPRLRKLVARMTADPADNATLASWGKRIGMAERTLTRILVRETGLSFGRWRQQLHIILAIQRLSRGASVKTVASDLGYENASSFVTMFRKALGDPPARYLAKRQPI